MALRSDERPRSDTRPSDPERDGTRTRKTTAAQQVSPMLEQVFAGGPPVRFVFWDGSALGPDVTPGSVVLRSPDAITRVVFAPGDLGVARAFVAGDLDVDGDLYGVLAALHEETAAARRLSLAALLAGAHAALRLGGVHRPPRPPLEEIRPAGWRHSRARDQAAVTHHYDVGNEFYRLVLGPAMTYSCARFEHERSSLEQAQAAKHDLICRKLGLHERSDARLLDVGCGWGSMALHAASTYGTPTVAITISPAQASTARARVAEAGLEDLVEVRLQDYRDLQGETFDAISSVGMFEHVGARHMGLYFATLFGLLSPGGRLLNHAISTPGGSKLAGRSFMNRYVFPDGELIDVADVAREMERAGFEVRDVESLREHYAQTLRAWVGNLEGSWEEAVRLVGEARARVWRLYMAASANGFEDGGLAIHQVLGVRATARGDSGMPRIRRGWN